MEWWLRAAGIILIALLNVGSVRAQTEAPYFGGYHAPVISDDPPHLRTYPARLPRGTFTPVGSDRTDGAPKKPDEIAASSTGLRAKFDGIWKWRLDFDGHCYGLNTRPMTVKDGQITAVFTSPYVHLVFFSGEIRYDGQASVRILGAFRGVGHGRFTETEASGSIDVGHPEGSCTGTWAAQRVSTN